VSIRFTRWALLLLATIAQGATARYTISLHPGTAAVEARFPAAGAQTVRFELQSWAGYDFYDDIEAVSAHDLRGKALAVQSPAPGQWSVENQGRGFTLSWRVKASKDSMVGKAPGGQFHATLLKDWVSMWGHAFVLLPTEQSLGEAPVAVRFQSNEFRHPDSTLPASGKLAHLKDLNDQLFLAGAFRFYRQGDRKYYFATTQTVVTDRELMDAVDRIFVAQTRYMGTPATRAPIFLFTDGRADSSGGTVVRNSAVFYPNLTQDLKSGNAGALRLIAHELFHLWNGSTMENASDAEWSDGKYGWFKEGFTEYYSGATLYREGIFDNAEFATFVNHLIVEYAQNGESLHATLDEMGSRHWKDRDHQQLPYTKGALLAVLMDLQLRARSRSLDDYMRAILPKGTYDLSNLRDAWVGMAGEAGRAFWDRYIPTAEPLPFAEILRFAKIPFEERETPTFALGFTIDKPTIEKGAKVVSVAPGSHAAEADIRPGDSLQGFSVSYGDVSKPARFNMLRGTERITINYSPVVTRGLVQVGDRLEALRGGAAIQ